MLTRQNIKFNIIFALIKKTCVKFDTGEQLMLGEKLRDLLAVKGMSKEELAEKCDLPVETIRNIYYGKTTDPKVSTVLKISRALNISVNCIMGECSHSPEERALLEYFRECGNHGRRVALSVVKYEALRAKEERGVTGQYRVPCLIPQGNIRQGIDYDTCDVTDIHTSREDAYMALKMTNNDFVPLYCRGDIILISNRFPENKELGVFYDNGRAFIRQYLEEDDQYRLKCLHNSSQDMIFKRMDEIEYVGTCCSVLRA